MSNKSNATKSGKPQWLQFFLISYLLILGYMYLTNPGKDEKAAQAALDHAAQTTTGTLVQQQSTSSDEATTSPLRTVDGNSSVTIESHPGKLTSLRTQFYDIDIDKVGAVVNSWRLRDTGSQSYNPEEHTTGVELVRHLPSVNQKFISHQNWPLEVYFKEHNVNSYEDFNHIAWTSQKITSHSVRLDSPPIRGLRVQKTLELPNADYYSKLRVTVFNDNNSTVPIQDELNRGLTLRWGPGLVQRDLANPDTSADRYDLAVARNSKEVKTFRPKIDDDPLQMQGTLEWAGIESKFFAALLVPDQPDDAAHHLQYFFRTLIPNSYQLNPVQEKNVERRAELEHYKPPLVVELSTSEFDLAPNSSRTFEFGIYLGPKKHDILKKYDHNLQTLMYSDSWWWMRALYLGMTDLLNWIHRAIIGNYGVAIILLTVIVKLVVFPLVHHSIKIQAKSSAEMKRVKPHIDAINEKYKDDAQEKQRQTWKIYKEHGINPLGAMRSCLPAIPQMPVFIALYRIANDTIDLQGAHFLWINDLSQADHLVHFAHAIPYVGSYFNIMPILVAITQMLSSKISMSRNLRNITDPNQQQMQKMMVFVVPLIVMVTMYHFPAGLMLYWMASNSWQIGQTLITNKILDREEEKHLKAGPPPRKEKKKANPNGFVAKMMAKAEATRKEMEQREQPAPKGGSGKQRNKR